ncbi:hypothetical protein [Frankia sp. Cppng1_Ct_nod]|uniref:hypothetical protein n=1 Tax=Frankia sp. Cppng1_Ct_nod TaxID=2897162 RepID=UPI00104146DA|nr:hypothetical protein [Frankia sp. Cppng1_Ct_nod]
MTAEGDSNEVRSPLTILMADDRVWVIHDDSDPANQVWKVIAVAPDASINEMRAGLAALPANLRYVGSENTPGERVMVFMRPGGVVPPGVTPGGVTLAFGPNPKKPE